MSSTLIEVVDALRVNGEGLQVLAAHCDVVSQSLLAATARPKVGLPVQATSVAVGSAYSAVDEVAAALAGVAQARAVKAAAAGAEFGATDRAGAQDVAVLGQV